MSRKPFLTSLLLLFCLVSVPAGLRAQVQATPSPDQKSSTPKVPEARAKNGKRLLGALDLMKLSAVGSPRLSPDGSHVAYTVGEVKMEKDKEWKTVTQIWVVTTTGGKALQYTRGEKNSTAPEWSPDGSTLAFLSDREKDGERQVWMMMADGGEAWVATSHKGGVSAFRFSPDGKHLLLTAADQPSKDEEERKKVKDDPMVIDRDIKMSHLWLWDIEKKEGKRLTEGSFTISDPQFSPDGTRVSYTRRPTPKADDGGSSEVWVLTIAGGEKKKLVSIEGPNENARWSHDGKWLAYTGTSDLSGGVTQSFLYLVPVAGGAPKVVTTKFDLNVGTPVWARDSRTIYFQANTLEANEIFALDVGSETVKQLSRRGASLNIADTSRDGKTIIGTLSGPAPTEVFKSTPDFKSFSVITSHNDWLKDYALAETEVVKWKSSDGLEIEGLLTKPVGYEEGKKVPLLLNPHGGPTGASVNSFNSTVQVLAANGFAVLQPNFRGSTGKTLAFAQANKNTWGKGDYRGLHYRR